MNEVEKIARCPACDRDQFDDLVFAGECRVCKKPSQVTNCKACRLVICLDCRFKRIPIPGKDELIYHPPPVPMISISVDMEWSMQHGWTFLVSPKKLSAKGFAKAVRQVYHFYLTMKKDLENKRQPVAEDVARCLLDLEPGRVRVRQYVRPNPDSLEIQI